MVILEYKREVCTGDKKLTLMIIKLEFKVLKMDAITRGGKTERAKIQGLYLGLETIAYSWTKISESTQSWKMWKGYSVGAMALLEDWQLLQICGLTESKPEDW